jgi:hypothetical protein
VNRVPPARRSYLSSLVCYVEDRSSASVRRGLQDLADGKLQPA